MSISQSIPEIDVVNYLLSKSRVTLKPLLRLAFLELSFYALVQKNKCLPDNDKIISSLVGLSVKQWQKIKNDVLEEWLLIDGYWYVPKWLTVEADKK